MKRAIFLLILLVLAFTGCATLDVASDILTILVPDEVVKCEDCTKDKPCGGKWCVDGKWYQNKEVEIR